MTDFQNITLASLVCAGLHPGHVDIDLSQPPALPQMRLPAGAEKFLHPTCDETTREIEGSFLGRHEFARIQRIRAMNAGFIDRARRGTV